MYGPWNTDGLEGKLLIILIMGKGFQRTHPAQGLSRCPHPQVTGAATTIKLWPVLIQQMACLSCLYLGVVCLAVPCNTQKLGEMHLFYSFSILLPHSFVSLINCKEVQQSDTIYSVPYRSWKSFTVLYQHPNSIAEKNRGTISHQITAVLFMHYLPFHGCT